MASAARPRGRRSPGRVPGSRREHDGGSLVQLMSLSFQEVRDRVEQPVSRDQRARGGILPSGSVAGARPYGRKNHIREDRRRVRDAADARARFFGPPFEGLSGSRASPARRWLSGLGGPQFLHATSGNCSQGTGFVAESGGGKGGRRPAGQGTARGSLPTLADTCSTGDCGGRSFRIHTSHFPLRPDRAGALMLRRRR